MYPTYIIKKGDTYLYVTSEIYIVRTLPSQTRWKMKRIYTHAEWTTDLNKATKFTTYDAVDDAIKHFGGERISYFRERKRKKRQRHVTRKT